VQAQLRQRGRVLQGAVNGPAAPDGQAALEAKLREGIAKFRFDDTDGTNDDAETATAI
jgi:hypothetical protein